MAEIKESSYMFKNMSEEYYKLKAAEREVHKALKQKGLFLDQKDFNIMEALNDACSEYSDDKEESKDSKSEGKSCFISVENIDQPLSISKPDPLAYSGHLPLKNIGNLNHLGRSSAEREFLEVPSFSNSATPNSFTLEKISHHSKYTNKSNHSFASKTSKRLLFQDAKIERRPNNLRVQKGDFPCICNKSNGIENYFQGYEVYPYDPYALLNLEPDSDDQSILGGNELVRSISAPAHETCEFEEKLIGPLPLERQPFSNRVNQERPAHNYRDP